MRNLLILGLLILLVSSGCHTRRKARRREEAAREQAANTKKYRKPAPAKIPVQEHKATTQEYIARYKDIAIREMNKYGIPASIILAQGILESNSGNSELARNANNHFGIKSTKDWKGKTYYRQTDEDNSVFRAYPNAESSYKDHSEFLTRSRYADLHRYRSDDYKSWAYGLKKDGYATNPKYPQLLINMIEKYELWRYD